MPPATLIQFQFVDLDVGGGDDTECGGDYLILRNGGRPSSPFFLINPRQGSHQNGHLCGRQMPSVTNTSSNSLFVSFRSDDQASQSRGFKLSYTQLTNGCGGSVLLTPGASESIIQSPNYPNSPPPHTECIWTVLAPPGERIHLDIDNLDVKPSRR